MNRVLNGVLLTLGLLSLFGCSTAPAALEQANHTVKVMSLLNDEAEVFRGVMHQAQAARVESMTRQKLDLETFKASATLEDTARKSAGDTRSAALRDQLLANADRVAQVRSQLQTVPANYSKQLDALLAPLPSTSASLTEAQAKAAAMGQELSASTRRKELLGFVDALRTSLKENRDRIKKAEVDAAKTQQDSDNDAKQAAPK